VGHLINRVFCYIFVVIQRRGKEYPKMLIGSESPINKFFMYKNCLPRLTLRKYFENCLVKFDKPSLSALRRHV
jgi:hypothetical protein